MGADKNITICPYNDGVECATATCERCGWYPPVEKERIKTIMSKEKKFKIPFTGYCEVWANSPEEASCMADAGEMFYAEYDFGEPEYPEEDEDELD